MQSPEELTGVMDSSEAGPDPWGPSPRVEQREIHVAVPRLCQGVPVVVAVP